MYRTLLKTQERVDGTEAKSTLRFVDNLVYCLIRQGKREEALTYAQRLVDGGRQIYGTNSHGIWLSEKLLEDLQPKK